MNRRRWMQGLAALGAGAVALLKFRRAGASLPPTLDSGVGSQAGTWGPVELEGRRHIFARARSLAWVELRPGDVDNRLPSDRVYMRHGNLNYAHATDKDGGGLASARISPVNDLTGEAFRDVAEVDTCAGTLVRYKMKPSREGGGQSRLVPKGDPSKPFETYVWRGNYDLVDQKTGEVLRQVRWRWVAQ